MYPVFFFLGSDFFGVGGGRLGGCICGGGDNSAICGGDSSWAGGVYASVGEGIGSGDVWVADSA